MSVNKFDKAVARDLTVDSEAANTVALTTFGNAAGSFQLFRVDASPNGVVTGSIGDFAIDTTNGVQYFKKSGSATNTGWEVSAVGTTYKSYSLSNPGSAGVFYIGGGYNYSSTDVTLTIGGTVTQTFGGANEAHAAHFFAVASGAGGADLVLTLSGTSITDAGVATGADSEILVADTDAAATNQYFESEKKWLGTVTYTLTGAAGSFTFNYGHAKYEDFGNMNVILTDFEATGQMRASETGLNIELLHHEATAFLYSVAAFIPNQTALISLATDYGSFNDVPSGDNFAYKRTGMSQAILSNGDNEGLIIRITTSVNNSINHASLHTGVTIT